MKNNVVVIIIFVLFPFTISAQKSFEDLEKIQNSFFDLSNPVLYIQRDTNTMIRIDILYTKNSTVQGLFIDTYFVNNVIDSINGYSMLFTNNMITQSNGWLYDMLMYCTNCLGTSFGQIDSYDGYKDMINDFYIHTNTGQFFKIYEVVAIVDKFQIDTVLQKKIYPDFSKDFNWVYRVNSILSQKEYTGSLNGLKLKREHFPVIVSPIITK